MNENEKPTDEAANDRLPSETHRRQRGRNIAVGLVLFGLVVLFYVVSIVKMGAR